MSTPAIQQFDENLKQVAVGCLYLLTGRAILEFPQSTQGHPSGKVYVTRSANSALRGGDQVYFPFSVPQDWWHKVVVPVLLNPDVRIYVRDRLSLTNELNQSLLALEEFDTLIARILSYLKISCVTAGYAPEQILTGEEVAPPPVSPDNVDRNPLHRTLFDIRYRLVDVP